MTSDSPRPWSCSKDGQRLQWQRTALVCPTCGPLHGLPPWPDRREADLATWRIDSAEPDRF